jgi:hypothetical protein
LLWVWQRCHSKEVQEQVGNSGFVSAQAALPKSLAVVAGWLLQLL